MWRTAEPAQEGTDYTITDHVNGLHAQLCPDARTLELIRAANPATPTPPFLAAPPNAEGVTLHAWLPPTLADEAAALLAGVAAPAATAAPAAHHTHPGHSAREIPFTAA